MRRSVRSHLERPCPSRRSRSPSACAGVVPQVPRPPAVRDATLRLGQRADVSGRLAASEAGRRVALQYAGPRAHAGGRSRRRPSKRGRPLPLPRAPEALGRGADRAAARHGARPPASAGAVGARSGAGEPRAARRRRRPARRRPPRPRRARRRGRARAWHAAAAHARPARRRGGRRERPLARRRARAHAGERPLRRARSSREVPGHAAAARALRGRPPQRRRARARRHAAGVPPGPRVVVRAATAAARPAARRSRPGRSASRTRRCRAARW